jgi:hypothetical protein
MLSPLGSFLIPDVRREASRYRDGFIDMLQQIGECRLGSSSHKLTFATRQQWWMKARQFGH